MTAGDRSIIVRFCSMFGELPRAPGRERLYTAVRQRSRRREIHEEPQVAHHDEFFAERIRGLYGLLPVRPSRRRAEVSYRAHLLRQCDRSRHDELRRPG